MEHQPAAQARALSPTPLSPTRSQLAYFLYAIAFADVGQALSAEQKAKLARLRQSNPKDPKGPFWYSDRIEYARAALRNFETYGAGASEMIQRTQQLLAEMDALPQ